MKMIVLGVLAVAGAILAVTGGQSRAGASCPPIVRPDTIALGIGAALAPARLTEQDALVAAQQAGWATRLNQGTNMTFAYGVFDPHMKVKTGAGVVAVPPSDVWAITVGGLNDPANLPLVVPADNRLTAPPIFHFLTVYIDDATGQEIDARED